MSFGQTLDQLALENRGSSSRESFWEQIGVTSVRGVKPSWSCIKLWDWSVEDPSSPVLSEPMEFPTARGEFAPYFLSPSDLSHQQQSEEEKLMVALGISDRNLFACKRQTKLCVTEPSRNPTAKANFFAHSFQAPSSQLSDQKNPYRRFWCTPSTKSSCIWWVFYRLPFEFFPSFCSSPYRDTKPSPSFLPFASCHPSLCIHVFILGGDVW